MVKNLPASAGDAGNSGLISGSGRSLGEGNGSPLWYFCLGNLMDRGAWRAIVRGVTKSQTQLSARTYTDIHTHTHTHTHKAGKISDSQVTPRPS